MTIRRLPQWMPMTGITLFGSIWVKRLNDRMTIAHEEAHARQQREHPIWFWVSYCLLLPLGPNRWRREWEAEAYGTVEARWGVPVESLARTLSGPLYGWCCTERQAREAIERWRDAK